MDKVSQAEDAEAERHVKSPAGQQALRELQDHSEQVIREARRRALDVAAAGAPAKSALIPRRLLDMTRDALLKRLDELRGMFDGQLAVQLPRPRSAVARRPALPSGRDRSATRQRGAGGVRELRVRRARRAAQQLLRRWGVEHDTPVPVEKLVRARRLDVVDGQHVRQRIQHAIHLFRAGSGQIDDRGVRGLVVVGRPVGRAFLGLRGSRDHLGQGRNRLAPGTGTICTR